MFDDNEDRASKRFHDVLQATKKCRSQKERRERLLEFGFEFHDEEDDGAEIAEEQAAIPKNERQQRLVNYLHSNAQPSEESLYDFITEKRAPDTNYPLFRRYFRGANQQLKLLLLFGLDINPIDISLLENLSFFNNFLLNLSEFIKYCIKACVLIDDLENFRTIAYIFESVAIEHDYDAYYALLQHEDISQEKKSVLNSLLGEHNEDIVV